MPRERGEVWRRLKHRFSPDTAHNQVGAMIRSLQPPKIKDLELLNYALEKWEDGLRKQQEVTGEVPLNDATKRALLTKMVPDDLGRHLKLNATRLDSYDKLRWEVMNYLTLENPQADVGMQIDHVHEGFGEEWPQAEWPEWQGGEEELGAFGKGGKGKGKGKGKLGPKGKGKGD